MSLSHPFEPEALTFHAELLETGLLAWRRLLKFDLIVALG
jgi:hypothetical protein